jgi:hypothetical protein
MISPATWLNARRVAALRKDLPDLAADIHHDQPLHRGAYLANIEAHFQKRNDFDAVRRIRRAASNLLKEDL